MRNALRKLGNSLDNLTLHIKSKDINSQLDELFIELWDKSTEDFTEDRVQEITDILVEAQLGNYSKEVFVKAKAIESQLWSVVEYKATVRKPGRVDEPAIAI